MRLAHYNFTIAKSTSRGSALSMAMKALLPMEILKQALSYKSKIRKKF